MLPFRRRYWRNRNHHHTDTPGAEQVTHFCRLLHSPLPESMNNDDPPLSKPLSDAQRIRKVIKELIQTERAYVKDLNCMIERYLEPMKEETFLSGDDMEQLFGNIQEIVQFQKKFLQSLEDAVQLEPEFSIFSEPAKFKRILFSLGGSFLFYANHFKLYSSFCASHSKAQKVLNPENNVPLREFLRARNPKQQHSATLESYLIKPIQRILKYPLLLRQLKELTDCQTDEHHHLSEALRGMEAVAEHINEMQKIYEEYGNVFDDLTKQHREIPHLHVNKALDLNVGELQMYGTVNWLNILNELGKIKKGTELVTLVFVFKAGMVLLTQERNKAKKKQKQPASSKPVVAAEGELTRFMTAIPVDQLKIRTTVSDTERHGLWEVVHCRSEKDGRPERVFQFASSHEAKREFLRTIHATIRESVRRMSLSSTKTPSKGKSSHPPDQPEQEPTSQQPQPYISHGHKRPDSLVTSPVSRSIGKKKGKQIKADMVRHSMDLDDRVITTGSVSEQATDFRTRSQTLTDLNNMDIQEGEGDSSQSGSQSTIASGDAKSGNAKLLHSSNNPVTYSNQSIHKDTMGSPIWKPRNSSGKSNESECDVGGEKTLQVRTPSSNTGEGSIHSTAGATEYREVSNVLYDEKQKSVILEQHQHVMLFSHEDTEC